MITGFETNAAATSLRVAEYTAACSPEESFKDLEDSRSSDWVEELRLTTENFNTMYRAKLLVRRIRVVSYLRDGNLD